MTTTVQSGEAIGPARTRAEWVASIGMPLAVFGVYISLLPAINAALALRLEGMNSDTAASNLSWVLGLGALCAMIVNPVAGRFSDRSTSRFGARRFWISLGAGVGFIGLVIVAFAPNVLLIIVGWVIAQSGFNAALAALFAILPDQVPAQWRGKVAALIGVAGNAATPFGLFFVQLVGSAVLQALIPGIIGLVLIAGFVAMLKETPQPPSEEPFGLGKLFGAFVFNPRKHPDLGWAWLTRALMTCAQMTALSYLTLFLIEDFGMSNDEAATKVFYATLVNVVGVLITTSLAGWLSDKLGVRKPFVVVAGLIGVVGLVTIALAPNYGTLLVGEFVMGAGMGSFYAVDLALVTDVLPEDGDNAKDLGVINIAQAAPQSLIPAAAPSIISATGGYPGLFLTGGAFGVLGALAVLPVKKVK
ncbi:MFS transporter [Kineosporia sp. J2-2]|uniref:MFS transporter n=1 Tax=Kineosporia corallincola TaxID=2835133 RepID=A0ABS5TDE9_9ACTN|nr:MFS transporter [Kineosporia corallincola]MBT0769114.1 MFS transporter [Kineosporia corallincola]